MVLVWQGLLVPAVAVPPSVTTPIPVPNAGGLPLPGDGPLWVPAEAL